MATHDAVERLAGGIAHDFDLLLTSIIDHADTLSDCLSPGDPRATEVAAIRRAAEQASALTRELLAFSRTQTLRPAAVDINQAIARASHSLRRLLGGRIALHIEPGPAVPPVSADPAQLDQILYQLALKARGAMPGGGAVTIATATAHVAPAEARISDIEPGDYVALSVTDTGAEIGPLAQQHLFEPFFPATAHEPATGLGLAIVYGAVKQSGGDVKVESPLGADGRGSRFTVLLPAARGASRAAAPEGDTVLLVGGNRDVQSFIGDVLRRRGYQLLRADDAREAVRVADTHALQIRLLITAGVSGVGAANAIRERHPGMRRLHVSASTDEGAEHDIGGGGTRAVLVPPFTPSALARKVRAALA